MTPNVYVFIHPGDRSRVARLGFGICLLGWKTEKDAVFCPRKKTKCDLIYADVSAGCGGTEEIIFEEAKKLGAKGVFLDGNESSPEITELAAGLRSRELEVFASVEAGNCANFVTQEKGEHRFVSPRRHKTSISISGKTVKSLISREQLEALIQKLCPKENYSEELGSNYFSSKSKSETLFVVYDTPETFRRRIYSCNAQNVFLEMSSVKEYLTEGK